MKKVVLLLVVCLCGLAFAKVVTGSAERIERNDNPVVLTQETNKLEFYPTIGYQGLLKGSDGKLIADGSYSLTFSVYDAEEAKEKIWKEVQSVEIKNGILNCNIGSVKKLNLPFDKQYWLSVAVGEEELPRMIMGGTPYSLHARRIADDAIIGGKNISVIKEDDGQIRISGSTDLKDASGEIYNLYDTYLSDGTTAAYGTKSISSSNIITYEDSTYVGQRSHAFGQSTYAGGCYSLTTGYSTKALGWYSIAGGALSEAIGGYSLALGYSAKANHDHSVAIGRQAISDGLYGGSVAIGEKTEALGSYSTAIGYKDSSTTSLAVTIGNHNKASSSYSFALGSNCKAITNSYSFAIGNNAKSSGGNSYSIGSYTDAVEDYSFAMGYKMKNDIPNSFMIGYPSAASSDSSTIYIDDEKVCIGHTKAEIDSASNHASYNNKGLFVKGPVYAKELHLDTDLWADYVFSKNYNLKPLNEVEEFIGKNNHLPGMVPEKEVVLKGVSVGDVQVKLLEKIEELTLYLIDQNKQLTLQNEQMEQQNNRIEQLEQLLK